MIDCDPVLNERIIGVFAADKLPRDIPSTPFGFIANTDIHAKPGRHWCAFFSDAPGHYEFFDSYGRGPKQNSEYFSQWLEKRSKTLRSNVQQIQSSSSNVCGLMCVLYLRTRLEGYAMTEFINYFDFCNLDANDSFVYNVTSTAYSQCVSEDTPFNQTCGSCVM
jgi:hypothetical protein